jgi:hypothetical protein
MTKADLIHHILSSWAGENKINYTFEQQQEVVKELSKYLMIKKRVFKKVSKGEEK